LIQHRVEIQAQISENGLNRLCLHLGIGMRKVANVDDQIGR